MKCVKCIFSRDSNGAGPIAGLCSPHTIETMEIAAAMGKPLIIRSSYKPAEGRERRQVDGVKLLWWRGKWRAESMRRYL